MTDPMELAEEIERMDEYGARAADRALIAAALRLAEAALVVVGDPTDAESVAFVGRLDAYWKARGA